MTGCLFILKQLIISSSKKIHHTERKKQQHHNLPKQATAQGYTHFNFL